MGITAMAFSVEHKRVTVIGAARSGIAVANAVHRLGGIAKISDMKSREGLMSELQGLEHSARITVECGGHTREFIEQSDYVVLSPGVPHTVPPVIWAREAGIEVMGEIEFAARLCPCPIIAVTGSNGKTTTATLIAEVMRASGRRAVLCGNIGSPFSKHILDLKPSDTVVLEISSFQLESTTTFKPHVAVWLNFSQNHLDRHADMQEYFDAKKKIFASQGQEDWAVLNAAQPELAALAAHLKPKVIFFNGPNKPAGIDNPNQLAVMAAVSAFGVTEDVCRRVFESFKGVEHRQELVRTLDGVDYVNDSKSTTPEAGRWALTHLKKPLVMICGGSDKHLDFTPLKSLVRSRVKIMIAIGQTREALRAAFADVVPVQICDTLPQAVDAARSAAEPGDCVVLSPMCASFDMFNNYEHRGQVFKEIVRRLE